MLIPLPVYRSGLVEESASQKTFDSLFARVHNPDTLRGNVFGKSPLGRTNACLRTWCSGEGGIFSILNATDALRLAQIHLICYTEDTKGLSREWSMMPPSRARSERDSASSPLLF